MAENYAVAGSDSENSFDANAEKNQTGMGKIKVTFLVPECLRKDNIIKYASESFAPIKWIDEIKEELEMEGIHDDMLKFINTRDGS